VTGSGKTEIYLQAIARSLESGKQAIVLVPEISLTPQMISRFKTRFGPSVAVLHSRLSDGERYDEWRRIQSGGANVVVGARSAIFAPFARLGLVIIDEEHEGTYKQEEVPRYHAREVAEERCRLEGALLILGSATPSLETFQRAISGQVRLSTLKERVDGNPLPPVELIDMRQELAMENRSIFSRRLQEELTEAARSGEGAILFLNRRGFSTFVLCRECGYVVKCPSCEVSMAHHIELGGLCCHYCGYSIPLPRTCPKCQSRYIRGFGAGTERVEEELKKLFPHLRALRMDIDTTRRKGSHAAILEAFARGEADVLIGTQMIAKGLDIERVTLVGVISADTSLNLPDFRSAERTFQLVTQVAGRAGRGSKPGRVLVQTYTPEHYSIQAARDHDYWRFFETEIQFREALNYPPFTSLIHLVISGAQEAEVEQVARDVGEALRSAGIPGEVLGPSPAPLPRLKGRYRHHLVLKGSTLEPLVRSLKTWLAARWGNRRRSLDIRLSVDVNPMSIL
jgi:primosomal protein N' (replication factor Y)